MTQEQVKMTSPVSTPASAAPDDEIRLTPTEASCLRLVSLKISYARVAAALGISTRTMSRIVDKFKDTPMPMPEMDVMGQWVTGLAGQAVSVYADIIHGADTTATARDRLAAARDILSHLSIIVPRDAREMATVPSTPDELTKEIVDILSLYKAGNEQAPEDGSDAVTEPSVN